MNQINESLRQIVKIQRMNTNPRFESPTCFFLLIIFRFEFSNAKRISFNKNFHQLGKFINARELKHRVSNASRVVAETRIHGGWIEDGSRTRSMRRQLVDIAIPGDISPGNVSRKPPFGTVTNKRKSWYYSSFKSESECLNGR